METKYYTMTEKDELIKNFLVIPKKFKKHLKNKEMLWIYKVLNLVDNRVYIGKTNDLYRRALNYVNEYLKGEVSRDLPEAFQEMGFQKFMMVPLEIALSERSAEIKEKYYIDLYDSIENGFNSIIGSAPTYKNRKRPSVPQTLYAKMIKSKLVACINTVTHEIVFSTGLKLFGDYIGRSKDEIKSAAKRETRLNGYFIYYMNIIDFKNQMISAEAKVSKNKLYKDYRLQYYDFIKYGNYLMEYLLDRNHNPEKFSVRFITQSNDPLGYEVGKLDVFLDYYKNASNKIV